MTSHRTPTTDESNAPTDALSFRRRFRGYDPDEVAMALGILKADIARLEFELARTRGEAPVVEEHAVATTGARSEAGSWFERKWTEGEDDHLDDAFARFFAGPVKRPSRRGSRRSSTDANSAPARS
jgi:DivIVA domain-containing protein